MKSMKAMLKRFTQKGPGDEEITAAINEGLPAFKDMLKDMLKPAGPTEEKAMPQSSESAADDAVDGVSIVGPGSLLQCSVSAISMTAKGSAAQETPSTPLKSLPVGKPGTLSVSTNSETKSATGGEGVAKDRVSAYESVTLAVASHCPSALKRSKWCVSDFDLRALMYNGNISMVYHAVDKRSGITVALKLYKRHKLTVIERHQVAREIKLHVGLAHDAIIAMYAAWKDRSYVYLALEWAPGGDVYSYLRSSRGRLAEDVAVSLILEPFLSGLAVIHAQGLIHRDIKPENILLNHSFQIKIADFGLSIDSKNEVANTRLGTIDYLAPEILDCPVKQHPTDNKQNPSIGYTSKVDCWSVGVLAYELLTGGPPFAAPHPQQTLHLIRTKEVEYPPHLSRDAVDFMRAVLVREPALRPTIPELLEHAWIRRHARRQTPSNEARYVRRNSVPLSLLTQGISRSMPGHAKDMAPASPQHTKMAPPQSITPPAASPPHPLPSPITTPTKPTPPAAASLGTKRPLPPATTTMIQSAAYATGSASGPLPVMQHSLHGGAQQAAGGCITVGNDDSSSDDGEQQEAGAVPLPAGSATKPAPPASIKPDAANLLGVAPSGGSRTAKFYSTAGGSAGAAAAAAAAASLAKRGATGTTSQSGTASMFTSTCPLPPIERANSYLNPDRPDPKRKLALDGDGLF
eukprot:CAMPEP_0202861950 /NCGR_PEP_ID=MMETSP1391-20130828/3158_1 /ASSEMBLY_ACC=CAM_ASM_000867 /TAXON_ID=1034604 /ORGANISM="Chlamydomonas leiostraca, Strain SAG 11-49" /LENGTH=688 /DNA_ID=CAMNT_0049541413 /DNA_START=154 /DNA_END=2220 /DNA_ORIENTATION=-